METALLGESSGGGGGRRRVIHGRSDAIAYGDPYQKAAALVDLAEDGIGLPEELLDQANFGTKAKYYFMFIRFDVLWTLNYFAMILLNFLEKPLWCFKYSSYSCSDRDYFFLGQLPYFSVAESITYEVVTLLILMVHIFFPISFEGFRIFWKSWLNRLKITLLLIMVADVLVFGLYLSPVAFNHLPFRTAPYIRVVFFILSIRDLCNSILVLVGMLPTYLNVLALWLLFLLFSSWLAFVIFEDTEQGKIIFTSYGRTLYQMFVLFTTSNNPDVWIPAYKASRWYSLFFVVYVLLGVYFVTNLILAVVYDSFKSELAKQVVQKDHLRTRILSKAFNLADSNDNRSLPRCIFVKLYVEDKDDVEGNLGFLNKEQCVRLFEELNKYRTLPQISREDFELIFDELDDTHDFKINLDEFADLCNAIALRFQKEPSVPYFESCPSIYHSLASEKLKKFVRSPTFGYVVAFILLMNLVAVITETTLDIANSSAQKAWQKVEFVFGWLYVLEMLLKMYAYGPENYWRDGQNRFDCIVTLVIVIGETTTFVAPNSLTFLSNGEWIRYLLIARMLRLIRLLMHVPQYRAFVATFLTLIPSLMPYLGTIFCVMCIYCSIGVQVFGGIVNFGNPKLEGTDLSDEEYLLFNFNDYPNGMVSLFNLLVMGNWQIWMQSYVDLTGTPWTNVYFVSFYLVTVLLLLNLVVAFVLEAFFAEMELEESEKAGNIESESQGNGSTRRRNVGMKTRSQRVDILLHHILSAELEKTETSTQ